MNSRESQKLDRFSKFSLSDSSETEFQTSLRASRGGRSLLTQSDSLLPPETTQAIITEFSSILSRVNPQDLETTFQSVKAVRDLILRDQNFVKQTVELFLMTDPLQIIIPLLGFQQYPALQVFPPCLFSNYFFLVPSCLGS